MIDDSSNKTLVRKVAWFLAVFSLVAMIVALMFFRRTSDKDTFFGSLVAMIVAMMFFRRTSDKDTFFTLVQHGHQDRSRCQQSTQLP